MNCPACLEKITVLQETCPHCSADISLIKILEETTVKFATEAEEALKKNILDRDARAKANVVCYLNGNSEKTEALLMRKPTVSQYIMDGIIRYKAFGTILTLSLFGLALTGIVIMQVQRLAQIDLMLAPIALTTSIGDAAVLDQSTPSLIEEETNVSFVIVRKGDSLWKISRDLYRTGQFVEKLARENTIQIDSRLHPGQKLRIPQDTP